MNLKYFVAQSQYGFTALSLPIRAQYRLRPKASANGPATQPFPGIPCLQLEVMKPDFAIDDEPRTRAHDWTNDS